MRVSALLLFCLLAGCVARDDSEDNIARPEDPSRSIMPAKGLTLDELTCNPGSVVPLEGVQRVLVAPGYEVTVRIETTSHGNGLLFVEDENGECLRTKIYDRHREDESWYEFEGGLLPYQFVDFDDDGELELAIDGIVEFHTKNGNIRRERRVERWECLDGNWYRIWKADYPIENVGRDGKIDFERHHRILGTDHFGRDWSVECISRPGSGYRMCLFFRDGEFVDSLELEHARYAPEFRLETSNLASFVVVRLEGVHGTGLSSRVDHWYSLGKGGIDAARAFYVSGYVSGWGSPFDRELEVDMKLIEAGDVYLEARGTLYLESSWSYDDSFSAAPTNDGNSGRLFTVHRTAMYRWNAETRTLDPEDVARAESVELMMNGGSDYLVEHVHPELEEYALKWAPEVCGWLEWLKSECKEESNRATLNHLIRRCS